MLKEKKSFLKENTNLRKKIENLKSTLKKFIIGSQKLQAILNNQKIMFDKVEIDYNSLKK